MKNNTTNKKKKTSKTNNNQNRRSEVGLFVPLRPFDIMPPKIKRNLNYIDSSYTRTNSGANYLVYSFRINDLFDPDPLILTGSVSGLKEIMQFYTTYRVTSTNVHLEISNNESFPLIYGLAFSQQSLVGLISNRDDAVNVLENDFSTRGRMISAKGGMDRDEIRTTLDISQLLGNRSQYMSEIGYTGQGLASPTIPLWLQLVVASPTGANLPNGVTTALTLEFHSEFFGRVNLRA